MRRIFQIIMLLSFISVVAFTQNEQSISLNIGDPAPPLRVKEWIKGIPVQQFEKGKMYVVEFWATWCVPCIAAMPYLSALANEYKGKVTILGIDTYENKKTSIEKVKAFVDSMGSRMDYNVAADDSSFMAAGWIDASGEQGIPKSFVIDREGKLAWIGHPSQLADVLPGIVNNTWDIKKYMAKRDFDRYLRELDKELNYEFIKYEGNYFKNGDFGKPDSVLLLVDKILKKEPALKYAPFIGSRTFAALLRTDPHKAYEYGKTAIVTPTYEEPVYSFIARDIEWYSSEIDLPAEIFRLGAEAYQAEIDQITYPELFNIAKKYDKVAEWYACAGDISKAIIAQEKAIEALKKRKNFSVTELAAYESHLTEYRKMPIENTLVDSLNTKSQPKSF